MTTGAKVAIILGSATLLIGGGIGIYFLTKKKETTIGGGSGNSSTTSNKTNEKLQKAQETIQTSADIINSVKDFWGSLGIGEKNKLQKAQPERVKDLAKGKEVEAIYANKQNENDLVFVYTDGTKIEYWVGGGYNICEVIEDDFQDGDFKKISATGDDDVPTKMSNQQMLKNYGIVTC